MKKTNKIFSVILALALVFAMAIPAFAAADGTITVTNPTEGQIYSVYKMFSFVSSGDDSGLYSVTSEWEKFVTEGEGKDYVAVKNGTVEWIGATDEEAKAAFAQKALVYAKNNSIGATKSATAGEGALTISDLELGYYLVDSSLGALCALDTTNKAAEVTEKNEGPALEKKIVEGNALVDANNVAIGDTVTYQATITVGEGAENYVMHDKMNETLEYKGITSVVVGSETVAAENYAVATSGLDDGCTFEIAFDNDYIATLAKGTKIVVTYTAVLKDNAIVGNEGNPNTAWLEYGDDIDVDNDGKPDNKTPDDSVITYTTKLVVNKVDGDEKALEGAGFTLYKKNAEGDYDVVSVIGAEAGRTEFVWNGLEEGEYKIEETTVPAGYNKADDIVFTITCTEPETVNSTADTATWTSSEEVVKVIDSDYYQTTIKNETGNLLPETGGIGTTIFYIVGAILVVGAVVLLISKKRMAAEA